MKFFSFEVAFYLYKSTIQSCMKYCCHACAGAPTVFSPLSAGGFEHFSMLAKSGGLALFEFLEGGGFFQGGGGGRGFFVSNFQLLMKYHIRLNYSNTIII